MVQTEFKLFGFFPIHLYGVMIAIGLLACFFVLFEYGKYLGFSEEETDFVFYNGVVAIAVGFFGAAVWQAFYDYIDKIKSGVANPTFKITGSITVIGGLITGAACFLIGAYIFRKKHYYLVTRLLVVAPCCITIAHAFGRIGCFFGGCCYGKPAEGFFSFLGVSFPKNSLYIYYDGTPVYPTQLFEAAFLFALFGVLSYLALKKNYKYNIVVYMVSYSIWRFLIEFVRADYRGSFLGTLSPSQTQSIILLIASVGVFFIVKKLNENMEADLAAKEKALALQTAADGDNFKEEKVDDLKAENVDDSKENEINKTINSDK